MSSSAHTANGKLLLSGEYFVLGGALAIGLPTRLGQRLVVKEGAGSDIVWDSYKPNGEKWFSGKFDLFGFDPIKTTDNQIAETLKQLLVESVRLNSEFLSKWKKYKVSTYLDFEKEWGLGSSSSLVTCMAEWADVDPFDLQFNTFGGSGYDIACATAKGPIFYQVDSGIVASETPAFDPNFKEQLYFVYVGNKKNTKEALADFNRLKVASNTIDDISQLSKEISGAKELPGFEKLIVEHEKIVADTIKLERQQQKSFSDYWGAIKSLGAWGGDFVLATSNRDPQTTKEYFKQKGCSTIFSYDDLILSKNTENALEMV